jgi:hypothetical protein
MEAYIAAQVSEIERDLIEGHMALCQSCAQEVHDLRTFAVRLAAREEPRQWQWWVALAAFWSAPRYQVVGAVAVLLMAAVLVPWLVFQGGEEQQRVVWQVPERPSTSEGPTHRFLASEGGGAVPPSATLSFQSWTYQASLRHDQELSALARAHSIPREPTAAFGFAARTEATSFFLLGSLYAKTLAHLHSSNVDAAVQGLTSLEQELVALQAPSSLTSEVNQAQNRLASQQAPSQEVGESLARLQPHSEVYAQSRGTEQLVLFQAGTWLVDLSLTAAINNKALLRQPAKAQYFRRELQRLNAPQRVLEVLDQMQHIMDSPDMTDANVSEVLTLVKELQMLLA